MKITIKKLKLSFAVLTTMMFSLVVSEAQALVCPNPLEVTGTEACEDADFEQGVLCVIEPIEGMLPSGVDQEVSSGSVCILGKFKEATDVEKLVDIVVAYEFTMDPLLGPGGVEIPQIEALAADSGEFMASLSLPEDGLYDVLIQTRLVQDDGSFLDIPISRRVLRLAPPGFVVSNARLGGSEADCDMGGEECLNVSDTTVQSNDPNVTPVSSVGLSTSSGSAIGAAGSIDLCVSSGGEDTNSGSQIAIRAVNTITDNSTSPSREITIEATCVGENEDTCPKVSSPFCPDGFVINVPIGHGENKIDLFVANPLTGFNFGAGISESITIDPFEVDLKGPELCVTYLDEGGQEIPNVDGAVLLASEAPEFVMVDVTLGPCGETPEDALIESNPGICTPSNPPVDETGDWPVTMRIHNSEEALRLCTREQGGTLHFRGRLNALRYPVNTVTLTARDAVGNETVETHAFSYGNVRPLYNEDGRFDLADAVIPDGVGGFISADFIQGELLALVEAVANSQKFKDDVFLTLLDPISPRGRRQDSCHLLFNKTTENVRTAKFFNPEIGRISVPSLYLLNDNRIWVQLKVEGFNTDIDIFTMAFKDSDRDEDDDTRDDDSDADRICDDEEEIDGVCNLADSVPARGSFPDCPQYDPDNHGNEKDGFADWDDDGDGFPDECDIEGTVVPDEVFKFGLLPAELNMKELAINMQLRVVREDGRTKFEVVNVPDRFLVEIIPEDGVRFVNITCGEDKSRAMVDDETGLIDINKTECEAVRDLNAELNSSGRDPNDLNQNLDQQVLKIMESTFRCVLPAQMETALEKLDTEKLTNIQFDLFDQEMNFDLFAPLASGEVRIDSTGVGFAGGGLLLTGGVSDSLTGTAIDSRDFMDALPEEFRIAKFGPVSPADEAVADPIVAAKEMGRDIGLAIKEETINSTLHALDLLLWKLADEEGDDSQSLDTSNAALRDSGFGVPNIDGSLCADQIGTCCDKDGKTVPDDSWECFPFPLTIEKVLGKTTLNYVDFNDDTIPGTPTDALSPVVMRTALSPFFPPTVRIVDAFPLQSFNGSQPTDPAVVMLELEIGLGDIGMSVYEGNDNGKIKNWCDPDRFPNMNPSRCEQGDESTNMPIARFALSGSVSVTALAQVRDDGIIRLSAGLSSVLADGELTPGNEMVLDEEKTYLKISVLENNTIVPDPQIAASFKESIETILPKYVFGNARSIRLSVPTMLPLDNFCALFPEVDECVDQCLMNPDKDGCELFSDIDELWEDLELGDFGVEGLTLLKPLLGVTGDNLGELRYLLIGGGVEFELSN